MRVQRRRVWQRMRVRVRVRMRVRVVKGVGVVGRRLGVVQVSLPIVHLVAVDAGTDTAGGDEQRVLANHRNIYGEATMTDK